MSGSVNASSPTKCPEQQTACAVKLAVLHYEQHPIFRLLSLSSLPAMQVPELETFSAQWSSAHMTSFTCLIFIFSVQILMCLWKYSYMQISHYLRLYCLLHIRKNKNKKHSRSLKHSKTVFTCLSFMYKLCFYFLFIFMNVKGVWIWRKRSHAWWFCVLGQND